MTRRVQFDSIILNVQHTSVLPSALKKNKNGFILLDTFVVLKKGTKEHLRIESVIHFMKKSYVAGCCIIPAVVESIK